MITFRTAQIDGDHMFVFDPHRVPLSGDADGVIEQVAGEVDAEPADVSEEIASDTLDDL